MAPSATTAKELPTVLAAPVNVAGPVALGRPLFNVSKMGGLGGQKYCLR